MAAVEHSKGHGTTYPNPVAQVDDALGFLARNAAALEVDPATIVLTGDSDGAHTAGQVALIIADPAYASAIGISRPLMVHQLSGMLLFSGAYDPSAVNFEGNYWWFLNMVLWAIWG